MSRKEMIERLKQEHPELFLENHKTQGQIWAEMEAARLIEKEKKEEQKKEEEYPRNLQ